MKENIFELSTDELKKIASNLKTKIEEGLKKDGTEILDIPTYITPDDNIEDGKVLALDWGGTNFRAAIVEFKNGSATIVETIKKGLSAKETVGFSMNVLLETMTSWISELKKLDSKVTRIGYCFSYPAESMTNGDAKLLRWTKGIDIPEMIGKPIGESLVNHLNNHKNINTKFTSIKVINDTVACLFAGLVDADKDAYIGLIVGTGTNMATLMLENKIEKLKSNGTGLVPINLESGNFFPPYLTVIDNVVDAVSNNKGNQRFEKAISGGYLGEIFKTVFSEHKIKYDFDAADLSDIINNPDKNSKDFVDVANWIYTRSAKLVAASLAGLTYVLVSHDPSIKNVSLAADGSLFWSNDYAKQVADELKLLLPAGVTIDIAPAMSDPNLIGSAIAALS